MELLEPLAEPAPSIQGARFAAAIEDRKTGQTVVVTSDEPITAYALDDDDDERRWWKDGEKHPDSVLVASWDGEPCVIFVEITGTVKLKEKARQVVDPMDRKAAQIDAGVEHFHPAGRSGATRSHGDAHHDRWEAGEDLPTPVPAKSHRVAGVVLGFHQQARTPLGPKTFYGHRVPRLVWSPVPSTRNRAVIQLADLARQLGW
jgi:hypothetical protein